ncbi:hypothetical protein MUN81_04375 [Hymenobacter sp. 5317J-9]|uniref:beta strand repeat-containing protein n=1 Tax=Hymenobacter sp. 5317J-9 TaxID=2932250 RepID=UPI001FD65C0B|nr:hypothetical protein [Hymenobacter sp. 5317J-9]UOQ98730.1 hypothetical protein MUN81_04375 [Hymenobacter sp. 5317J-9]
MRISLPSRLATSVAEPLRRTVNRAGSSFRWGAGLLGLLLAGSASDASAQTCNQVVTFNYTNATPDGSRTTGSDKVSSGSPGTSVTYSNYTGSAGAAINTFAVGANAVLGTGKFLVWQRNVTGGGPTSDVATVVYTFSRPVNNLTMTFTDVDKDLVNGSFIDRLTLDAYPTATGGTLIDLAPSNFSGPGINNNIQKFVGNGSTATATSDPVYKRNAITGIAVSNGITTGDITVSFPGTVQRIEFTYENIAPFATNTTDRTHTIGFEFLTFCAQADVYANFTAGPTTGLPSGTNTFTVNFGNSGPESSTTTTRSVTIPAGATVTSTGGGTLVGNTLSFPTIASTSGTNTSFTYSYTLPAVPGIYYAPNTATTTTSASQNGTTANDTDSRTTLVAPVTDVATTISGPASITQGNLITLNVTTSNLGALPTAEVVQTVALPANLTNVFVSNNGTYDAASGTVTFPTLATLGAGQTVANTISFKATGSDFGPIARVSLAAGNSSDSNTANNTAYYNGSAGITNVQFNYPPTNPLVANLNTTISASAQTVNAGNQVTLTVVAANAGPSPATNVVELVQLLPGLTGLQLDGASGTPSGNTVNFASGAQYNTTTGLLTLPAITTLASASSQSYSIKFNAPTNVGDGGMLLTASVGATTTSSATITVDPIVADNAASTKVNVVPNADVAASIAGLGSVLLGQEVRYTAFFTNNGPSTAVNLIPTVQLPAGLTGVSTDGTYNSGTGVVTFPAIETSPVGITQVYTVSFTPTTVGSYPATASVTTSSVDGTYANNSASATTTVAASADLTVRLNGPSTVAVNGPVTYVAETTNNGPSTSGTVTTTIQLPANLAAAPTLSPNGVYTASTGIVTFTNAALVSGATVANAATFVNPQALNSQLTSTAQVTGATVTDPVSTNNSATTASVNVTASANTGISMFTTLTPNVTTVAPGGSVTYTVVFDNNNGTNTANNVVQRLYLPPGTVVTGTSTGAGTYNQTTGVYTFSGTSLSSNGGNARDTYTVTVTAPTVGTLYAVSAVAGPYNEGTTAAAAADNYAYRTVTLTPTVAPTAYDVTTSISGPDAALPNTTLTYTVQTLNNGPATAPSVVQTVTLLNGVTASNITGGGVQTGNTITFPAITNQVPGPAGEVINTFTISMNAPGTGGTFVSANVTATGESNTGNNQASVTTQPLNQPPYAANVVNALQSPQGNTAGALNISPLVGTDDNTVTSYVLTSLPNATTQGTLYYNNGGTYTAITSTSVSLTPTQAASLRFDPVSTFTGNVFFTYAAIDNGNLQSLDALYTIRVGQDNAALYTVLPAKGGSAANGFTKYLNGDVIAYVYDLNGARYNSSGQLYNTTTGVLATGAANGLATTGTNATTTPAATTQLSNIGVSLNAATGLFTVTDRTKLVAGTYTIPVTTTDLFGGVTVNNVSFTIGAAPLPVELKEFAVTAVKNIDAALTWTTASEKNNDHFDVERSFNGSDFVKIAQVKGQGTTSAGSTYALTDAGAGAKATGRVYYRLLQVDTDGTSTYSPVRTVAFTKSAVELGIALSPNPASGNTQLDLTSLPAGTYQVSVLDAMGRTVLGKVLPAGLAHALDLNTIASGTYVVLVRGQNGGQVVNLTKRLVKE